MQCDSSYAVSFAAEMEQGLILAAHRLPESKFADTATRLMTRPLLAPL